MNAARSRLYVGRRLAAVFQRRVFGLSRLHDGATDSTSPLYPIPRFDGRLVSVYRALRTVGLLLPPWSYRIARERLPRSHRMRRRFHRRTLGDNY